MSVINHPDAFVKASIIIAALSVAAFFGYKIYAAYKIDHAIEMLCRRSGKAWKPLSDTSNKYRSCLLDFHMWLNKGLTIEQ